MQVRSIITGTRWLATQCAKRVERTDSWQRLRHFYHIGFFPRRDRPKPPELVDVLKKQVQSYRFATSNCIAYKKGRIYPFVTWRLENQVRAEWNKLMIMHELARRYHPGFISGDIYAYFPAGYEAKLLRGTDPGKIIRKRWHISPLRPRPSPLPLVQKKQRQAP
jgi:hypothetical protein